MSRISKSVEMGSRLVIARSWREEEWGVAYNGHGVSFELMKIF